MRFSPSIRVLFIFLFSVFGLFWSAGGIMQTCEKNSKYDVKYNAKVEKQHPKNEQQKAYKTCAFLRPLRNVKNKTETTDKSSSRGIYESSKDGILPSIRAIKDRVAQHMRAMELSDDNIEKTLRGIDTLINVWHVPRPTAENAVRVANKLKEDMKNAGREPTSIRIYLYHWKYWSNAYGIRLNLISPKAARKYQRDHGELPASAVVIPQIVDDPEKRAKKMLPPGDVRKIIDAGNTQRDQAFLAIELYCGCRSTELTKVTMSDVHLDDRDGQTYIVLRRTKGMKQRKVWIKQSIVDEFFRPYIIARNQECVARGWDTPYLWLTNKGTQFTYDDARQMVDRIYERENLSYEYFSQHCFRHTAGSAIAKTSGLAAARDTLGHTDGRITDKWYIHTSDDELRNAAAALDY